MSEISEEDLKVLRDLWKRVTLPLEQHGVNIMHEFFKKHPDYLDFFPKLKGIDVEKLKDVPTIHVRGNNIMNLLDKTINIYDTKNGKLEMSNLWISLARIPKIRRLPENVITEFEDAVLEYFTSLLAMNDTQISSFHSLLKVVTENTLKARQ